MVINQLLAEGVRDLQNIKYTNPQLEVRLILSKLMDVDKSYLYAHGDGTVPEEIVLKFRSWIKRRKGGYPLQYLLGVQEFMGLELEVSEGVLIPRGDTENLVYYLADYIEANYFDKEFTLLDIGIGTGAISLAIAKEFPKGKIYGVELHDKPFQIAERNRQKYSLDNTTYYKGNLFSPFSENKWKGFFNIIVSNPPYIPEGERKNLQREVSEFEPEAALFAGEDGLGFYRKIAVDSKMHLKEKGLLAFEIGHDQGQAVSDILRKEGFQEIVLLQDLEERDRVVAGSL